MVVWSNNNEGKQQPVIGEVASSWHTCALQHPAISKTDGDIQTACLNRWFNISLATNNCNDPS